MKVHEVTEPVKCLTFTGRLQEKAMKDATEKPTQTLISKYSFKSQEKNLKIDCRVLWRSQASSNSWVKKQKF